MKSFKDIILPNENHSSNIYKTTSIPIVENPSSLETNSGLPRKKIERRKK